MWSKPFKNYISFFSALQFHKIFPNFNFGEPVNSKIKIQRFFYTPFAQKLKRLNRAWTSLYWTAMLSFCFQTSRHHGGNTLGPNNAPGLDFVDHIFLNLKKSGQDQSNEGSNFVLSLLEVGH